MLVKALSCFILGMHGERPDARDVGGLDCPSHSIFEKTRAETSTLPLNTHGQAGQEHDRNWVLGKTFAEAIWSVDSRDFAHGQRMIPDDPV